MARPPSIRRPTLTVMSREVARIQRKQERALSRLEAAIKEKWPAEDVLKLEAEAALSSGDRDTLESAAKVAALLEKSKERDEEEAPPAGEGDVQAALERAKALAGPKAPASEDEAEP